MPRLATCHVCRTLTRLPDPPASAPLVPARVAWIEHGQEVEHVYRDPHGMPVMVAKYDPALEDWITRHEHADIHIPDFQKYDLAFIDRDTWQAYDVVAQIKEGMSKDHGVMYAERDQLKDDALKCYGEHHRPKTSCIDVFSESKLIGSKESRHHLAPDERMYLCHLCPFVHGYVVPQIRLKRGDYDEDGDAVMKRQRRREFLQRQAMLRRLRGGR